MIFFTSNDSPEEWWPAVAMSNAQRAACARRILHLAMPSVPSPSDWTLVFRSMQDRMVTQVSAHYNLPSNWPTLISPSFAGWAPRPNSIVPPSSSILPPTCSSTGSSSASPSAPAARVMSPSLAQELQRLQTSKLNSSSSSSTDSSALLHHPLQFPLQWQNDLFDSLKQEETYHWLGEVPPIELFLPDGQPHPMCHLHLQLHRQRLLDSLPKNSSDSAMLTWQQSLQTKIDRFFAQRGAPSVPTLLHPQPSRPVSVTTSLPASMATLITVRSASSPTTRPPSVAVITPPPSRPLQVDSPAQPQPLPPLTPPIPPTQVDSPVVVDLISPTPPQDLTNDEPTSPRPPSSPLSPTLSARRLPPANPRPQPPPLRRQNAMPPMTPNEAQAWWAEKFKKK